MAAGGRFYSCYLLPHHGIFGGVGTVIFFGSIDANRNSGHDAISIAPNFWKSAVYNRFLFAHNILE